MADLRRPGLRNQRQKLKGPRRCADTIEQMRALLMMLKPIPHGWCVELTDGRELARFVGPGAEWRATRYLRRAAEALARPREPRASY